MPQPIDLQTEIARATAVERIQQVADRASLAAQQRGAADVLQQAEDRETLVAQTPESQSEHVDEELRRKNPYARRRQRKGQDNTPHEEPVRPPLSADEGQRLDVMI